MAKQRYVVGHFLHGVWARLAIACLAPCLVAAHVAHAADLDAAPTSETPPSAQGATGPDAQRADSQRLFNSVLKVQTRVGANARSAASLGVEREGSGVVIEDGLVLTIGYLLIEAEQVTLTDARGRTMPATIVGYDHPTGLGLVRSLTPLGVKPTPLGESSSLKERTPVMIVNHEGRDDATLAFVVARREFTGNWEYQLDDAIFTSPPTLKWSGAALIDRDGRLVGIGSLIVRDAATRGETTLPGNMFVPIDLLKPVLQEVVKGGRRAGPARPWLGVNADEVQGRLLVARVSPDGPAANAGIEAGDMILAVGGRGVHTQAEFYRRVWDYGAAGVEIPLRVLHDIDVREVKVRSIDRMEYFSPRASN